MIIRDSVALLLVLFVVAELATCGCGYFRDQHGEAKTIPAPLSNLPSEVSGSLYRVWVGNELQINHGDHTSYLILQGVNNPDTGDDLEQLAIDALRDLIGNSEIRATIVGRDAMQRAVAEVFVEDQSLNLRMVEIGWGSYDGTEFDGAEQLAKAEAKAKQQKLGMWASR